MRLRTKAILAGTVFAVSPLVGGASVLDNPSFSVSPLVIVWAADSTGGVPIVGDFIVGAVGAADADLISDDVFTVITGTLDSAAGGTAVGGFPLEVVGSPSGDFNTDTSGDGTLDAADVLAPFELDADFDVDSSTPQTSFYVASNAPFSISAEVTDVTLDPVFAAFSTAYLGFVDLTMEVAPVGAARTDGTITYGASAQAPHTGGELAGFNTPVDILDLVGNPTLVFEGNQRTAATPGTIADQSVRFDLAYPLVGATIGGYDLSLGVVDFNLTVEYTVFVP
ncbi:MAG: hypothetical protein AAFY34_14790 [Pseudomonadota bacterium]